jgi:N-acetyl-anhydromuramyl-L-alanine amidase AmpD
VWSREVVPSSVPAGRMEVAKVAVLANHRGHGPDLVLRWNDMPTVPAVIDVVVHLHGYSWASMTLPKHIEVWAGLDLSPVDGAAGIGRTRPTLTVLPRGHNTGVQVGRLYRYTFPALTTQDGLNALLRESLQGFSERVGGLPPKVGRLILTAHSGGGAPLMRILRRHDPHEVYVFDGLYQDATPLTDWAARHIKADRQAVEGGAAPNGAMRVFFGPSTRSYSLRLHRAVAGALQDAPASVRDRYRVEASQLGHWQIARQYGWRMLADPAADVPDATRPAAGAAVRREDEIRSDESPLPHQTWPNTSSEAEPVDRWVEEDESELGELDTEAREDLEGLDLDRLDPADPEDELLGWAEPEVDVPTWAEDTEETEFDQDERGPGELDEDQEFGPIESLEPLEEDLEDLEDLEVEDLEDLEDESASLADSLEDGSAGASQLMLAEAAWRGELLLDPLTPSPGEPPADFQTAAPQAGAPPAPPPVATRVDVSVRTDFTVKTSTGVRFDWAHGEAVRGARAQIVGTAISGLTSAQGNVRLNTTGLADGFHTIRIEHGTADQSSPDLAGPTVADSLTTPPARIYRPLNIWVFTRGGQISLAMVALFSAHGGIGNRNRANFDVTHLPIDWKPVWMRSPMKATERRRSTADIDLIVVHRPDRADIGPAINTFLSATDVGNAHYLIDHNGHVIKFAEDRRKANQTGFSRWRNNTSLNELSIGIEVMHGQNGFTPMAMAALTALIERLRRAYPSIPVHRIVGHSDIATSKANRTLLSNRRLEDPGHHFDWVTLERRGLGMVPGPIAVGNAYGSIFSAGQPAVDLRNGDRDPHGTTPARLGGIPRPGLNATPIADLQADLEHIGYSVRPAAGALGQYDAHTVAAVDRFQRHFFSGTRESVCPTLGHVDGTTAGWIRAVRSSIP